MEKFKRLTAKKLDERNGGEIKDKTSDEEYDDWKKYQKEKFFETEES